MNRAMALVGLVIVFATQTVIARDHTGDSAAPVAVVTAEEFAELKAGPAELQDLPYASGHIGAHL